MNGRRPSIGADHLASVACADRTPDLPIPAIAPETDVAIPEERIRARWVTTAGRETALLDGTLHHATILINIEHMIVKRINITRFGPVVPLVVGADAGRRGVKGGAGVGEAVEVRRTTILLLDIENEAAMIRDLTINRAQDPLRHHGRRAEAVREIGRGRIALRPKAERTIVDEVAAVDTHAAGVVGHAQLQPVDPDLRRA